MSEQIKVKSDTSPNSSNPVKIQPAKTKSDGAGNARNRIYVRAVKGIYQSVRQRMGLVCMLSFLILPWLQYQGQQAILFDLANQQFRIFAVTFWPQDLLLLAFIFIIAAFALVLVTTFIGRVWCGYMCPQTVWTFIFIWFEEKIEGTRHQRMKLDQQPMTGKKAFKKIAKHACWIGFSLFTSLTFIGYFVEIGHLFIDFFTFSAGWLVSFWVLFFTVCTYGNAGWMREIMCTHICPYARLQSAMFDKDTYTVAYNPARGENRGPRSRKADPKTLGLGDCIDCNLCVQVCPTGIDIRNGLQYECINCGACIDACDGVMDKMGYQRGLISYTTERQLSGGFTRLFRTKLFAYSIILVVLIALFTTTLLSRTPFDLDIIRDRNQLFRENFSGEIENTYTLKVLNQSQTTVTYHLSLSELASEYKWIGEKSITVSAGQVESIPVTLAVDPSLLSDTRNDFYFVITMKSGQDKPVTLYEESRFFKGR
ncbi:cytochrome c oxidase accessory protein CcoG [Catenovulum adriaticum]|uniref:Cytochrome c oxidase accessory protein CcoG n=1 Tax=Catenovulum adriaticum TaxID=2984846 RepID=A0ABY7AMN1_9ALTE|nr:cytochrome c oxidase accessory protein CcoG [Catenovulum sp. TS8]WAJ70478.1 cytochrome c oxidase accessory protein CcoG [Catenovulum sp. TS8]